MAQLDDWLHRMVAMEASDIHLAVGNKPKVRVHGDIVDLEGEEELTSEKLGGMMHEICPDWRWEKYTQSGDMDFAYEVPDLARFRVNYLRQLRGEGCVLRQIPADIQSLEDLGAPDTLRMFANYRSGLVLVTGPTGSGKSTTLAAMVHDINHRYHKHVITIEDPIEFVHQSANCVITQREVGVDTPEFADALKDALREDPDVILVGEMRDLETISLALTLAETGVLVFATLHTNSAAKTVDRIIDVFPAQQQQQVRTMLSESLKGVISQQLLRRKAGGRIAAHEILVGSAALGNVIREGHIEKIPSMIQQGANQGMITMDQTLRKFLDQGIITGEEAYMKALDKSQFEEYFEAVLEGGAEPAPDEDTPEDTPQAPTQESTSESSPS